MVLSMSCIYLQCIYRSLGIRLHLPVSIANICDDSLNRLRLSSHRFAIDTGRRSRIPRDNRLCSCGAIQTEEHVICFCPLSQSIRSQFDTVEFTSIVKFFDCANTDLVCRIRSLILSSYDTFGVFLSMVFIY